MIPRAVGPIVVLLALLGAGAGPPLAAADGVDTILRRADDGIEAAVGLGPTRQQGDFGEHLDELLLATAEDPVSVPPIGSIREPERQPALVLPIFGGIAGGAAGLYGGAIAGAVLADDHEFWRNDYSLLLGAIVGEIVMLPIGVHLGNARKGSFAVDLGISALAGLPAWGLLAIAESGVVAITAAGLHLGAVVVAERKVAARRIAQRSATGSP